MQKFSLYGESIEFTDAECNTIMLREEYIEKATEARQDFLSYLGQLDPVQENFLDCLQNFGRDTIINYLTPVIEYAQTVAVNSEDFDKDFIMDLYIERIKSEWFDLLDGLADEYDRIWYDAESMRQYRELRKMSRGRWVGGGFGIKGALAGAAQAGILNAASAGIHSAVNAMGNANSNRKARNELRKLFRNVKDDLVKGLWSCIFDIRIVKMYVLDKCEKKQFFNYSAERFKTAELVVKQFENASKQIIDDQKELLIKNIKTCPFILEQYWILLKKFGDKDHELENLLSFLKAEELLAREKRKIIEQIAESINYSEEESLKKGMDRLCETEIFLGYSAKDLKKKVEKALYTIDEKKRTVRDIVITEEGEIREDKEVVFPTCEKAEEARRIIIAARGLYEEKITEENVDDIQREYEIILQKNVDIGIVQLVLEAIKKRIDDFNRKQKSVKNIIINDKGEIFEGQEIEYNSLEEAQIVKHIIHEIRLLYDMEVSENTETEIRDTYTRISVENEPYEVGLQVLEIVKERLDDFDRKCRTVNGKIYSNREDADLIRKRTFNGVIYATPKEALMAQKLTYDNILFKSLEEKECYISELKKLKMIIDNAIAFQEKIEAYKQIAAQQWRSDKIQEKICSFGKEIIEEFEKVMKEQSKKTGGLNFIIKSIIKIFALLIIFTISVSFSFLGVIIFVIILLATIGNIKKNHLQYKKIVKENNNLVRLKSQFQELATMTESGLLIRGTQIYISKNSIGLAKPMGIRYCTNCGRKLEENWLSCPFCGKNI